jgi:alpha-D-glucose phosphate-specific phosphoglucomutase
MTGIKFGTDGWRAVISEDFTFENVRKVAQATALYFKKSYPNKRLKMAVGYDRRFLSNKYAKIVTEVLIANKIKVLFLEGDVPTPCLCYAIKRERLIAGLMITASHNPSIFNGIKIKTKGGAPATEEITNKIENLLDKEKPILIGFEEGLKRKLIKIVDYKEKYINFLKSYIAIDKLKNTKFKILYDPMHGTGDNLLAEILKDTKIKITTIRSEIDPNFGGVSPEPIPKNLKETTKLMEGNTYDITIVTDGDSDRIGAIAPGGRFITPGWVLSLLLLHFLKNRNQKGAVVKTISNTTLVEKIANIYNLKLYETPVGFKHIAKLIQEKDILIGGEESGGIGFKGYIPERDGILSGLLLLELMANERKSINRIMKEVEEEFGKFYYKRIDLEYPENLKKILFKNFKKNSFKEILGKKIIKIKDYDGMKFIFEDESWLLFRLSGTEPILRIYCEAHSKNDVERLISFAYNFSFSLNKNVTKHVQNMSNMKCNILDLRLL